MTSKTPKQSGAPRPEPAAKPSSTKPAEIVRLRDLRAKSIEKLLEFATEAGIDNAGSMRKPELIYVLMEALAAGRVTILAEGVIDAPPAKPSRNRNHNNGGKHGNNHNNNGAKDAFGFMRSAEMAYLPDPEHDIYVPSDIIRKYGLRTGDTVEGAVRAPRRKGDRFALDKVASVNGKDPASSRNRVLFENLKPLYPDERFSLESSPAARMMSLVCPIGKGQRALIVSPPKAGKTMLLQDIARSITDGHPAAELFVLLIDERPEEVTDMERNVAGEVISSTFDEPASRHVQVAEMVIERAKRLVESGADVVILLDSITRLGRAYNSVAPGSGKILSGGVDANALQRPKRFFGAARNIEGGGSLTIIATALIDTGSRMDEVVFEEFKGTGNSELVLDRKLADKRVFPAIDVQKSGTRKEELLMPANELAMIGLVRRSMAAGDQGTAVEKMLAMIRETKTNEEFFELLARKTQVQ